MADARFHRSAGSLTLLEIAEAAGGKLVAEADPSRRFTGIATLAEGGPDQVSFLDNRRYVTAFAESAAGACIVHPRFASRAPAGMALILCDDPYRGYARVAARFHPEPPPPRGIHPAAQVDPDAEIGPDAAIEAGVVIEAGVRIGARCWIGPNSVIRAGVIIGDDARIDALVSVSHAVIGDRVRLFPGVRIGQDGFGYVLGAGGHLKVPQLGRVVIGNDVEIGANSAIDRGSLTDTSIGDGTVIDNLVQIGHNVRIGRGCVIAGMVGISGSAHLGDFVILGGQVGIAGHLRLGDGAQAAAQSGIHRDVPPGEVVGGTPAMPMRDFRRVAGALRRIGRRSAGTGAEE
jgi:UDP-3-O-[3-hydroxymyristoyl] glucosamine N-acyltransferase